MANASKVRETVQEQVEQDFNPAESARDRLARLEQEAAAVRAEVQAAEQSALNETLRPMLDAVVLKLEEITGKKCRNFTFRYQQPEDGAPANVPVVVKLEQGKPGLVIAHREVKPRQKDS